jgi:hypothetical protein
LVYLSPFWYFVQRKIWQPRSTFRERRRMTLPKMAASPKTPPKKTNNGFIRFLSTFPRRLRVFLWNTFFDIYFFWIRILGDTN